MQIQLMLVVLLLAMGLQDDAEDDADSLDDEAGENGSDSNLEDVDQDSVTAP
jgi:hypothetical protein